MAALCLTPALAAHSATYREVVETFGADSEGAKECVSFADRDFKRAADMLNRQLVFYDDGTLAAHASARHLELALCELDPGERVDLLVPLVSCTEFYAFDAVVASVVYYAYAEAMARADLQRALHLRVPLPFQVSLPNQACNMITDNKALTSYAAAILGPDAMAVLRFAFSPAGDPVPEPNGDHGTRSTNVMDDIQHKMRGLKRFYKDHVTPNSTEPFQSNSARAAWSDALANRVRALNCAVQLADEVKKDLEYLTHTHGLVVGAAAPIALHKAHDVASFEYYSGLQKIRRLCYSRLDGKGAAPALVSVLGCPPSDLPLSTIVCPPSDSPLSTIVRCRGAPAFTDDDNLDYAGNDFKGNSSGSRRVQTFRRTAAHVAAGGVAPLRPREGLPTAPIVQHLAIPGRLRYKSQHTYPEYDYHEALMGMDGRERQNTKLLRTSQGILTLARNIRAAVTPLLALLSITTVRVATGDDKTTRRSAWKQEFELNSDYGRGMVIDTEACVPLVKDSDTGEVVVPEALRRFMRLRDDMFAPVVSALKAVLTGFFSYEFVAIDVTVNAWAAYKPPKLKGVEEEVSAILDFWDKVHAAEALEHVRAALRYANKDDTAAEKILADPDADLPCVPLFAALDFVTPRVDSTDIPWEFRRGEVVSPAKRAYPARVPPPGKSAKDAYQPGQAPFKRARTQG